MVLLRLFLYGMAAPGTLVEAHDRLGDADALLTRTWVRNLMRELGVTVPSRQAIVQENERLLAVHGCWRLCPRPAHSPGKALLLSRPRNRATPSSRSSRRPSPAPRKSSSAGHCQGRPCSPFCRSCRTASAARPSTPGRRNRRRRTVWRRSRPAAPSPDSLRNSCTCWSTRRNHRIARHWLKRTIRSIRQSL